MAIHVLPLPGIPDVRPGDDLARILARAISESRVGVKTGDVLVVCQKVVSKAEGRVVDLATVEPSPFAIAWASEHEKDARLIELVLRESKRIVRMDRGNLIVETGPGWICANAGIDQSNALAPGVVTLLPADPDDSAARLRRELRGHLGVDLGIVVTDTFGRPWREGQVEFALGVAGIEPLDDLRGQRDRAGHELGVTVIATADQIACAAGLLMGKADGIPAVLVRGLTLPEASSDRATGRALIRPAENDLFR
ncbi:MAG: coenzyme F420-0:L-glutamate ligase [Deltaproteobacteria bacterium]|nr:coenzyme F420-0:L-glutamate ligase [Deltaproteobacteria bacterium]